MQNPSDPDATYDGHKGRGYQVQISETCHPENDVQLITCAIPQTAVESDMEATGKVLDNLESNDLLPKEMFADTGYCSDENILSAGDKGVELVGPVQSGGLIDRDDEALNIDDFNIDEQTEKVICCPKGLEPIFSVHNNETSTTNTVMAYAACSKCEFRNECPVEKHLLLRGGYVCRWEYRLLRNLIWEGCICRGRRGGNSCKNNIRTFNGERGRIYSHIQV